MGVAFGGNPMFNRASPSSHARCVTRILKEYLGDAPAGQARILDVGGTRSGFAHQVALPSGTRVIIANPEAGVGADYPYVSQIPPTEPGFDLAMMFGVIMYLQPADLVPLMNDVRQRLRAGGTLLVAEPDPEGLIGWAEMTAKKVFSRIRSVWDPTRFHFHTAGDTRRMLREAGFVRISDRPDLTPNAMGVMPPPLPPYFIVAATV